MLVPKEPIIENVWCTLNVLLLGMSVVSLGSGLYALPSVSVQYYERTQIAQFWKKMVSNANTTWNAGRLSWLQQLELVLDMPTAVPSAYAFRGEHIYLSIRLRCLLAPPLSFYLGREVLHQTRSSQGDAILAFSGEGDGFGHTFV